MVYIPEIPSDSYMVDVRSRVSNPNLPSSLGVRHREGRVLMFINDKLVNLNTVNAHRIGLDLAKSVLAPDEMRVIILNGEQVDLPDPLAHRLAASLLRKADEADDWQLKQPSRRKL